MSFTVQQVAQNITTAAGASITATFAGAIQAGETVGVIATYIGTNGAGTCADGLSNAFQQGATVAGIGWTKTTFYYLSHPGGTTTVTFTAPSSIANKGIVAFRISSTGTIEFADSAANTQASPGTGTDAVTTGAMTISQATGLIVAAALNVNSSGTLSIGTDFTDRGAIWNNFGRAESRATSSAADYSATWTTTGGANSYITGGLAFQEAAVASLVVNPLSGRGGAAAQPLVQ